MSLRLAIALLIGLVMDEAAIKTITVVKAIEIRVISRMMFLNQMTLARNSLEFWVAATLQFFCLTGAKPATFSISLNT